MTFQALVNDCCAYVHVEELIRFRKSNTILEAAKDWLDKEIDDLKKEMNGGIAHDSRVNL